MQGVQGGKGAGGSGQPFACVARWRGQASRRAGRRVCVRAGRWGGRVGRAGGLLLRTAIGAVLAELPLRLGEAILRHFRLGVRVPVVRAAPVVVRRVAPLWRPKERWGWAGSDLQRGVRRGECTLGVHS
jgi:hypothetical protein